MRPHSQSSFLFAQCISHRREHSKSRGGYCRASREAKLRKSVWDAVYKDGRPPESSMRPARARRGRARVFTSHEPQQKGQAMEPVRAAFFQKGLLWGLLGLESGEIDFYTNSSTYALPFSRTIPVRTPQSASRTEVSRPLCHGRAPLTAGRTTSTQRPKPSRLTYRRHSPRSLPSRSPPLSLASSL